MIKRFFSMLLVLVMLVGMIPATSLTAFSAAGGEVYVGGVAMSDGDYLAVGATKTQTTEPSGGYAYYENGKLTLDSYSYTGEGYLHNSSYGYYAAIYSKTDLTINLVGSNTLTQTYSDSDMIYVSGANLTVGGDGKLTGTSEDFALYAYKDITINGGTIAVTTYHVSIISACGNVIINGGDIIAESKGIDCIYADYDVTINGGNVTAISAKRSIGYGRSITIAKYLNIQASTTADGELGEYVAANHDSYKKIVITASITMGDINADGAFNVADVVALQKWLVCAKDAEKSIVEWKAGNFVDDDRLDVFDLSLMKRALLNS